MSDMTLRSLASMPWDGAELNLAAFGSLTLTVLVAATTPYVFQWSPKGGANDNDWFDWPLSAKAGGASSSAVSARGVFNGQAGGFVRLKSGTGSGGTFYIGAGS